MKNNLQHSRKYKVQKKQNICEIRMLKRVLK